MSNFKFRCSRCDWIGEPKLVEYEEIETCFGPENIEVCPDCGDSLLIFHHRSDPEKQTGEKTR